MSRIREDRPGLRITRMSFQDYVALRNRRGVRELPPGRFQRGKFDGALFLNEGRFMKGAL